MPAMFNPSDTSLLRSTFIPSEEELPIINIFQAHTKKEQDILLKRYDELATAARFLKHNIKVAEAMKAPIRKLPVEILQEIFRLLFYGEIERYLLHGFPGSSAELETIREVSHRWNAIAESTPALWRVFYFDDSTPLIKLEARFWLYLRRSGAVPLDITIRISSKKNKKHGKKSFFREEEVLNAIYDNRHRIRNFTILNGDGKTEKKLVDRLFSSVSTLPAELPLLHGVVLDLLPQYHFLPSFGAIDAPRLSHVSFGHHTLASLHHFTIPSLQNLRRLRVWTGSDPDIISTHAPILFYMHNLENLGWFDDFPNVLTFPTAPSFAKLEILEIECHPISAVSTFLSSVSLPSLHCLTLRHYTTNVYPPFENHFTTEKWGNLRFLALCGLSLMSDTCLTLLQKVTNIHALHLLDCDLHPQFLQRITTTDPTSSEVPLFPHLQELTLTGGTFDTSELGPLLKARSSRSLVRKWANTPTNHRRRLPIATIARRPIHSSSSHPFGTLRRVEVFPPTRNPDILAIPMNDALLLQELKDEFELLEKRYFPVFRGLCDPTSGDPRGLPFPEDYDSDAMIEIRSSGRDDDTDSDSD
ncbi:hypothetical protein M422DRAFT_777100 [Sphaerobolus stellatus SS14]|nr:hypothetical protein M422DRAFT_777100 [Sphaerobolus stellatus SS14]